MAPSPATTGGGNAIAELGLSFFASSVHSLPPNAYHGGELKRVDGTLVRFFKDGTAIAELGQSFIAGSVLPLSISHKGRGVLPDGSDYYAVGKGDSIKSPDGHRRMGCSRECG